MAVFIRLGWFPGFRCHSLSRVVVLASKSVQCAPALLYGRSTADLTDSFGPYRGLLDWPCLCYVTYLVSALSLVAFS